MAAANRLRPVYTSFADLPQPLGNFLLSKELSAEEARLATAYTLTRDQIDEVVDAIQDAVFNEQTLSEAVKQMKSQLVPQSLSAEQWPLFIQEVTRAELWPLRELFGDELKEMMEAEKIPSVGWSTARIILKPLTYGGAASEIAAMSGFSLVGSMRERLRDLIISKVKGVRIDSQIKEMLMRQSDFGGLGLDAAMADKTISVLNEFISSVRLMSEDEYADWLAEETRKRNAPEKPLTDDDQEIATIRAKMPPVPAVPSSVLEQAVQSIYSSLKDRPVDEYLVKRLQHVISSRLRDVRNEMELRMLLQRDSKVGGLGLPKALAETMAKSIEEGYALFHERIMEEEKHRLDEQLEEQKKKIEERRTREAEEHAQWYRDKILARKEQEEGKQRITEEIKRVYAVGPTNPINAHPMDVKEKTRETARFGELVSAPATTAPVETPNKASPTNGPSPVGSSTAAAAASTVQSAVPRPISTPATAPAPIQEVKVSKVTADMATTAQPRPRLDDVRFASPRLMGPVQELRGLSLSEFRRLAKDPQIAAQKIRQKIETLGQESFERRVEGIKAMQESSLQQAYIKLVADAFRSGRPVVQLAEELRAKGEDVPSPDEVAAIISLNSTLHF